MSNHRYPRNCYILLKNLDDAGRRTWASTVKNLLYTYGFGIVWISQEIGDTSNFLKAFKQRLVDCANQNWHESINTSSRCYHYKNYKSLLNVEKYLQLDIPMKHRIALSKFRCSNHKFGIETGRHTNVHRDKRICLYCYNNYEVKVLECEYHVFFECEKFTEIRANFLYNWYTSSSSEANFYYLLQSTNPNIIRHLAHYIYMLMK